MGLKAFSSLQIHNLLYVRQNIASNNHYASQEKAVSEAEPRKMAKGFLSFGCSQQLNICLLCALFLYCLSCLNWLSLHHTPGGSIHFPFHLMCSLKLAQLMPNSCPSQRSSKFSGNPEKSYTQFFSYETIKPTNYFRMTLKMFQENIDCFQDKELEIHQGSNDYL